MLDDNDGEVFKKKKNGKLSGGFFFFFNNQLFVRELVADVNGRNYLKLKILTFFLKNFIQLSCRGIEIQIGEVIMYNV